MNSGHLFNAIDFTFAHVRFKGFAQTGSMLNPIFWIKLIVIIRLYIGKVHFNLYYIICSFPMKAKNLFNLILNLVRPNSLNSF